MRVNVIMSKCHNVIIVYKKEPASVFAGSFG